MKNRMHWKWWYLTSEARSQKRLQIGPCSLRSLTLGEASCHSMRTNSPMEQSTWPPAKEPESTTGLHGNHLVGGQPRLLKPSEDWCPGWILTPIHDRSEPDLGCTPSLACSLDSSTIEPPKLKIPFSRCIRIMPSMGTQIQTIRKIHARLRKQKWPSQGGDHLQRNQIL